MMPEPVDKEISNQEIMRTLKDFRDEFRAVLPQLVRGDVYRAEQEAMKFRISELEKDRDQSEQDRKSTRNTAIGALIGAVITAIVSLIATFHGG